jgi:tripartite-type tricarboxylate transporter receptor subunit TctC
MAEAGMPGFESLQWFALFGPAALPRDIIARLNGEMTRWLESTEVRTRLSNEGLEPGGMPLDQFVAFTRADAARWMKVIKASGATAE